MKTITKTIFLQAESSMIVNDMKHLIQNRKGISVDSPRRINYGRQLEDGRTLSDYNIQNGSTIFLIERARGGMYHFTSGRQDFRYLPYDSAKAVKTVLEFKIKSKTRARHYSLTKLQDYVLQAQNVLSILYRNIQGIYTSQNIPDLKDIILPKTANDEDSSDSEENDDSSDE
jgi:hypothetical protein